LWKAGRYKLAALALKPRPVTRGGGSTRAFRHFLESKLVKAPARFAKPMARCKGGCGAGPLLSATF